MQAQASERRDAQVLQSSGPTAIAVRGLSKTYGQGETATKALQSVDLDVYPGEVLLMMGPSGSGKTTLLSMMGCILRATEGSVRIGERGEEIVGLRERDLPRVRLRYFGFVFQGFNLFPALSAGENVEIALDLKGTRGAEAKRRAAAALDSVGLSHKYDAPPADLSGGQQRVAIARAIVGDPEIILADELTAALDSMSGQAVMEMMINLARQRNRAVVIVTHDDRVFKYADRIVHIEDGRIIETDVRTRHAVGVTRKEQ
ncbi:MAG: ABC transporter ATP-binding protein [Pyrinomonadaceae bacterium]